MASETVQTFTDGNWDGSVLKSNQPVVVDFWAEWCGPCRMLAPTIETLASEYTGKVAVGKLNVDDNPETAMKYMVRGIPTVMVFKGGQMVDQVVGLVDKDSLKRVIDRHV
ncbi:MAG: thioredoxin [Vicinamibacterales bacterium]